MTSVDITVTWRRPHTSACWERSCDRKKQTKVHAANRGTTPTGRQDNRATGGQDNWATGGQASYTRSTYSRMDECPRTVNTLREGGTSQSGNRPIKTREGRALGEKGRGLLAS